MTDLAVAPTAVSSPRTAATPSTATPSSEAPVHRPSVLVVGPRSAARGGIGTVQYVLEQHTAALADLDLVTTHRDGSAAVVLRTMVVGVLDAARRLVVRRPDVVHMHVSQRTSVLRKGLLGLLARALGVPVVMHLHGSGFLDWFDGLSRPGRAIVGMLLRPHRPVVLSETLRTAYAERLGIPVKRVIALPNPVEWPPTLETVPDDEVVPAVFLGRFGARKGIYDLVEACTLLAPEQRRRLRLVAAGDGEVDEVRAAVAAAGIGDVIDVRDWLDRAERDDLLRRAQLLVLPSSHEGLPMAVLEAMAYRVTPLVTPVGALPEVVRDGENGVMTPVGDPAALADALTALIDDDERRLALAVQARADVEQYAAPRWAERLVAMWAKPL